MSHSDLILRIKEILLPLVATDVEREALLIDAFYLSDSRLFYEIDRKGTPPVFLSLLLKKLIEYGSPVEGRHPVAQLLFPVRLHFGVDKQAVIDALIEQCNELGKGPPDPTPKAPAPVSLGPVLTIDTPHAKRRPTVFISYARVDAEFADRLIEGLQASGHACWIDTTSIKGGDEWITTIAEGILNSYAMVVVVTRGALESRWVQDEILWARKRNKLIIPLLLEDVVDETRYFLLTGYQGVSVADRDCATALPGLLRALPPPPVAGAPPDSPPSRPEPVDARKLELAYLERLRLEELLNTDKYTPLAGASQLQRQARPEMKRVFELLPIARDLEAQHAPRKFEDAVAEIRRLRRAVLLGEPGGGKTTTIWKLAADLVANAIENRDAPIPLLIRLGRWTDVNQPIADFIAAQLGDLGAYLDPLLTEERAALLLDGLNELPAGQRDTKYPQVQQIIEQHPALMAVVSCRELDYNTVDLKFDRINITPLDPLRIREFAAHYLGEEKGEALFWKLAGQTARATHQEFLKALGSKLTDPDRIFWIVDQLPEAAKDAGWGWTREADWGWRNWIRDREKPSSLMVLARNPYMLLMLTSVYADLGELPENRGELFRLFVETLLNRERIPESEHAPLTEGLAKVAYAMQIRRADDETGDAMTVLPREEVKVILGERMLYLAGSASILSVGDQVRFTHQLLQEYFAARYMDLEIRAGRLKATEIWPPGKWWERTNWEEAAILLAGLYSDDCSRIVEWVAEANPEVAAMCAARSGAELATATRERLRS
ncbi:MAG: TIR domain-containing protein, partial [Blastocatellia bacterium]